MTTMSIELLTRCYVTQKQILRDIEEVVCSTSTDEPSLLKIKN